MLNHRGFSAWIKCGDEIISEYMTSVDEEDHVVQCWIPGQPGQMFSVHWKDHDTTFDTIGFISLDGYTVPGRFLFGRGDTSRAGVRTDHAQERPFLFQQVTEASSSSRPNSQQGVIKLSIKRIAKVDSIPANKFQKLPSSYGMTGNDLCIGFGPAREAHEQYAYTWGVKPHPDDNATGKKPVTPKKRHGLTASAEFLQSQGIMPRSKAKKPALQEMRRTPSYGTPGGHSERRLPSVTSSRARSPEAGPSLAGPTSEALELPKKKKQKTFGQLGIGSDEGRVSIPLGAQRTASGRIVGVKPDSYPGESLLCFDDDLPEEDEEDPSATEFAQSPPASQWTDSGYGWNH